MENISATDFCDWLNNKKVIFQQVGEWGALKIGADMMGHLIVEDNGTIVYFGTCPTDAVDAYNSHGKKKKN